MIDKDPLKDLTKLLEEKYKEIIELKRENGQLCEQIMKLEHIIETFEKKYER